MDRLIGGLKRGGLQQLLERCYPAVLPELRETVFDNAVNMVLAGGTSAQDEQDFIDDLISEDQIPPPNEVSR